MTKRSKTPARRVALVGTADSRKTAPVDDLSWEIWGLAARGDKISRATRWFELHRLAGEPQEWADNWRSIIRTWSSDVDIYMFYPEYDLGPRILPYPHAEIVDRFGSYFMTSSFSWAMAMAIHEMAPHGVLPKPGSCEIGIWGVDMEYGTEYREQRVGFRHFIDLARALNITISRQVDSGLSYEPVPYPMWQDDPLMNKLKMRENQNAQELNKLNDSLRHTRTLIAQNKAVQAELESLQLTMGEKGKTSKKDLMPRITELVKETGGLMTTSGQLSKDITTREGQHGEQAWLLDYLQP